MTLQRQTVNSKQQERSMCVMPSHIKTIHVQKCIIRLLIWLNLSNQICLQLMSFILRKSAGMMFIKFKNWLWSFHTEKGRLVLKSAKLNLSLSKMIEIKCWIGIKKKPTQIWNSWIRKSLCLFQGYTIRSYMVF